MELGLLMEGREGRLGDWEYQALISGAVLSVDNEQVTFQEEGAASVGDGVVVYLHLGVHPQTGETIVGRLLLAVPDSAQLSFLSYCGSFAGGARCASVREEQEVISFLEVGKVCHFFLAMETFCEDLPEEFQSPEDQGLCLRLRNDAASFHAYHNELVAALKGGELPDPDGLGRVGVVEVLLGCP